MRFSMVSCRGLWRHQSSERRRNKLRFACHWPQRDQLGHIQDGMDANGQLAYVRPEQPVRRQPRDEDEI